MDNLSETERFNLTIDALQHPICSVITRDSKIKNNKGSLMP